jgi:hypothetical protein
MFSQARAIADRKAILLFYREFEQDKFLKYDRYLERIVRPVYNLMHHHQKQTGFAVSFNLLVRALSENTVGLFTSTTGHLPKGIPNIR